MVTTKQSRTKLSPVSRPGAAVSHARLSRLDLDPLKGITGERATQHGSGYSTQTDSVLQDSSSFIDGRPKTAAEMQREKRLRDDPLAELLGPLFVSCKRCGTRIKLSPKSSYDPFHWVKHRERCLRRSIEAIKEIIRERGEQARSPGPQSAQQDSDITVAPDTQLATSSSVISLSPPSSPLPPSSLLQRPDDTESTTPSLTADEDEVEKFSYSHQALPPPGEDGQASRASIEPLTNAGEPITRPLCSLSVFRVSDMLAFEDYLHRSRRVPTHLGFPELLPSPDKWHDWSWGQLRAPVYVVGNHLKGVQAAAGTDPPLPDGDAGNNIRRPEARNPSDPHDGAFITAQSVREDPVVEHRP